MNPILISVYFILSVLTLSFFFKIYQYPILIDEGGVIESLSATGYFVCIAIMIHKGGLNFLKKYYYLVFLIFLFGLRELDFDKRFTAMGIFKSRFYSSDLVPLVEKIIGVILIILIIHILFKIINGHAKQFLNGLKDKKPVHFGVFLIILTLFFSKSIDGIDRKLNSLNIKIASQTSTYFEVAEEILELGIPILMIATFIVYITNSFNK